MNRFRPLLPCTLPLRRHRPSTVGIGYWDYHPVTRISACDTTAKNDIFFLKDYRRVTKYHLVTIFWPGPEVIQCLLPIHSVLRGRIHSFSLQSLPQRRIPLPDLK